MMICLDMVYMTNSFGFQDTNISFSLNINNKPQSNKLQKATIQIVSDK